MASVTRTGSFWDYGTSLYQSYQKTHTHTASQEELASIAKEEKAAVIEIAEKKLQKNS